MIHNNCVITIYDITRGETFTLQKEQNYLIYKII